MQIVQQLNSHLDFYFKNFDRTTLPIITHPLIQQLIKNEIDNEYNLFSLNEKIKNEVIPNIFFSRPDIYGLSLILNNGRNISYGNTPIYKYNIDDFLKNEVQGIVSVNATDGVPTLTIAKKLFELTSYQSSGLLLIDIKLNELTKIINDSKIGATGFIWIVNTDGKVIYHPDKSIMGTTIPPEKLGNFNNQSSGTYIKDDAKNETAVTFNHSSVTDLITVAEVPKSELMNDLFNLRNITIIFVILNIGLALFVIGGFSVYIINSLAYLQSKMNQVEMGDLTIRINERKNDKNELDRLNKSFNKMVQEMERLVKVVYKSELKEKEMRLKQRDAVLQSMQFQINPHFLYNTLEIINSSAIVNGVTKISNMATALADIFRYAVEGNKEPVTLNEEIENIKSFIEIQQERYPYLNVEFLFDNILISDVKAIRLIIQPIIENSFDHGYASHKPEYLKVQGKLCEDYYLFEVIDKGKGMSTATLNRYNSIFKLTDTDKMNRITYEKLENKIGLWNVHFRIRTTFGTPYGIHIKKSDSTGTIIQVKLPFIKPK